MRFQHAAAVAVLALGAAVLPATQAWAANIAVNPGFEAGTLAGWTCSATSSARVVTSPVHSGSYALTATPQDQDLARCRQTVSVRPSSTYTLSAWVRGNYVFLGAAGLSQTWAAPGAAWTQITMSFTTGSTATTTIYVNGWYGQGTYHADDVVLDGPPGGGTPPDTSPPSVPGGLTVGSPTSSSLRLNWSASTDNSGVINRYEVSRDGGSPISAGNTTTYSASGLSPSTTYRFRVRACDGSNNCSAYTAEVSGTTSAGTPPPPTGDIRFAPYIDITRSTPSLVSAANATGVRHYTLAFVLGDSTGCNPAWGGTIPLNDSRIMNDIRGLRNMGGQVVIASGGAAGPYLEHNCGSTSGLLAAYKRVLDAVGTNHLDVDVEASIDINKVNSALKQLQSERGTIISYTLRVQGQDYGVDPYSVQILQDAAAKGLNVLVNPMLMNFGGSGNWGDAMVSAANATVGQMKQIWPSKTDAQIKRLLGITPMIGRNDTGPITTQADARKLLSYAQTNHIGFIGFWSVGRDNGGCPNGTLSPSCSGISQSNYEFTNIFKAFSG